MSGSGIAVAGMRSHDASRGRGLCCRTVLVSLILHCGQGCSKPSGPELCPIEGQVWLDGQPLVSGSVSFRAESRGSGGGGNSSDEAGWHQPTGSISPEGKYRVYTQGRWGAPPGRYRVVVFSTESTAGTAAHPGLPRSVIPARYNDPRQSPLAVEVEPSPEPGRYDLRLVGHERANAR